MKKAIWIDVDNSPHVPLFTPLIKHYRASGIEVILTARDHAQTIELMNNAGLDKTFEIIGEHYGKSKINKIRGLLTRAKQLVSYIRKIRKNYDLKLAISHGSRSMVLAARWLKIPVITMYDYEFTETFIFNRFSDKVLIPEKIPDATLDEIGLPLDKRFKYNGLKEELYLNYFKPDKDFLRKLFEDSNLDISDDMVLVALRPPATTANYHDKASEDLFIELLKLLSDNKNVLSIISPRTNEQRLEIETLIENLSLNSKNFMILKEAVSGLDMALNVDLMISGGGTMNREAALLGTPVYSIFAGKQGALDRAMEKDGEIVFIRSTEDIKKIRLEKAEKRKAFSLTRKVENKVIEQIDAWLK